MYKSIVVSQPSAKHGSPRGRYKSRAFRCMAGVGALLVIAGIPGLAAQPALSQDVAREAAVAFECPQTSESGARDRLPATSPAIHGMFESAEREDIMNRVYEVIATMRARNAEPDLIVNTLLAAYCPLVASEVGLTAAQKKARIDLFAQQVTEIVYSDNRQRVRKVLVNVPLSPDLLRKVDEAARGARISRDVWLTRAIEMALPAAK